MISKDSSFFTILVRSLFDFRSFSLLQEWSLKRGIYYFFFLIFCFDLAVVLFQIPIVMESAHELTEWAVRELPHMRIENGQLSVEEVGEKDLFFQYREFFFVVRPESPISGEEIPAGVGESAFGAILLKDKMLLKGMFGYQKIAYPSQEHLLITPHTLMRWRDTFLWSAPFLLFLSNLFVILLSHSIETLAFSGLAWLLARLKKTEMPYGLCLLVSILSLGPTLSFALVGGLLGLHLGLVYLGVHLAYLYRAMVILTNQVQRL